MNVAAYDVSGVQSHCTDVTPFSSAMLLICGLSIKHVNRNSIYLLTRAGQSKYRNTSTQLHLEERDDLLRERDDARDDITEM